MKTFIGTGSGSIDQAVVQATDGLVNPTAIIFLTSYDYIQEVTPLIESKYPNIPSIGVIGGDRVANGKYGDFLAVLGFFEDSTVRCGIIDDISLCPIASYEDIEKNISQVSPGKDNTICIEFCTGAEEKIVTTLNAIFENRNISLIGGTAFAGLSQDIPIISYNGELYKDACVYAIIKNNNGKAKIYKNNIYTRVSNISHLATKVNSQMKALVELDGMPAADVYCNEMGISKNKIIENVLKNPLGRVINDEIFVSSMMSVEPDGSIINLKRFNQNDCVCFLEMTDYEETEKELVEKIKSDMKSISLIFSIDCYYRYLFYTEKDFFKTYVQGLSSIGNHIGMVSGGEQYVNQHVNQTMVCAVFE